MLRWVRDQAVEGFLVKSDALPTPIKTPPSKHASYNLSASRGSGPGHAHFLPPARVVGLLPSPSLLGKGKARSCPAKGKAMSGRLSTHHMLNMRSSASALRCLATRLQLRSTCTLTARKNTVVARESNDEVNDSPEWYLRRISSDRNTAALSPATRRNDLCRARNGLTRRGWLRDKCRFSQSDSSQSD